LSRALEHGQLLESPVVGAVQRAFVANQQGQTLRVVGYLAEYVGESVVIGFVCGLVVHVVAAALEFGAEQGGLDRADAAQAPAGYGHRFY